MLSLLLLLLLSQPQLPSAVSKYCRKCTFRGQAHVMCLFSGNQPHKRCVAYESWMSSADKRIILDMHNSYRRRLARGNETGWKGVALPAAANMLALSWDCELEGIARRWAALCQPSADYCFDALGYRAEMNYEILKGHWGANVSVFVNRWYATKRFLQPDNVSDYIRGFHMPYARMVWHHTRLLGCARSAFGGANDVLYCLYGPRGGARSHPVYEEGKGCSACPKDEPCDGDGLCGRPINGDCLMQSVGGAAGAAVRTTVLAAAVVLALLTACGPRSP